MYKIVILKLHPAILLSLFSLDIYDILIGNINLKNLDIEWMFPHNTEFQSLLLSFIIYILRLSLQEYIKLNIIHTIRWYILYIYIIPFLSIYTN